MRFPPRRASPEGQSFRSLGDETPSELRRKRDLAKRSGGDDSDDDYENVRDTKVMRQLMLTFITVSRWGFKSCAGPKALKISELLSTFYITDLQLLCYIRERYL